MLTDRNLVEERPHPISMVGGVQRIYRFKDGHGLSLCDGAGMHAYPFAWEAAVLENVSKDGGRFSLCYTTPLTEDVEVFNTEEEANEFIEKARLLFEGGAE